MGCQSNYGYRGIFFSKQLINKLDNCVHIEGTKEELSFVVDYVELARSLQEIYQWYQIVKYNYDLLKSAYKQDDNVAVNSNMIALLSAGKNMVELMHFCIGFAYGKESDELNRFRKECEQKEYDDNFCYRLLSRLRNFTQHGHIPVSKLNDSFCIDLEQIYHTPHYNFNETLRRDAEKIIEDIRTTQQRSFTLSIPPTVTSYICSIYKIFISFLRRIRPELTNKEFKFQQIIDQYPELIEHPNVPDMEGIVFYQLSDEDGTLHGVCTTEKPEKLLTYWSNDVINEHRLEKKSLKDMQSRMEKIWLYSGLPVR